MFKIFYEDIEVGDTSAFGSYTVTKEEIINFASQYDPQPFHISEEAAAHSVFKGLCASGWHTAAMTMRMLVDHIMESGLAGMGSPGVKEIKWPSPVFPGSVLHINQTILSKKRSRSRPKLGLLEVEIIVLDGKEQRVMEMTATMMVACRTSGDS